MAKVTYEFDLIEDSVALRGFQNLDKFYCALDAIYMLVSQELNQGSELKKEHMSNLLNRIRRESAIVHKLE